MKIRTRYSVIKKQILFAAALVLGGCSDTNAIECSALLGKVSAAYTGTNDENQIAEQGIDENGFSIYLRHKYGNLKNELEGLPDSCKDQAKYAILMSRAVSSKPDDSLGILEKARLREPDSAALVAEILKFKTLMKRHDPESAVDIGTVRKDVDLLLEVMEATNNVTQIALFHSELELLSGNYNEAILAANVALEANADDARSYAMAAQAEAARGRYEAALGILASEIIDKGGVEVWYENPRAILAAAQSYCGLNQAENAKQLFAVLHPNAPAIMHYDSFYKQAYETASGCQPENLKIKGSPISQPALIVQ
jgi:tetratricopeptide (TPR) repeat protein